MIREIIKVAASLNLILFLMLAIRQYTSIASEAKKTGGIMDSPTVSTMLLYALW